MPSAFLPDQSYIPISGDDCGDFLQGLITTDVETLEEGYTAPGALLTPQGKIMFYFLISRSGGGFAIEIDAESANALSKRLSMYKLRAKVDVGAPEASGTSLFWNGGETQNAVKDIRFEKAGGRLYRLQGKAAVDSDPSAYDTLRTEAIVVEPGLDFALGDVFPHDVMLDLNGGLSFKKGCYVGQEVVSRMQHRATARRRPVRVTGNAPLPAPGTALTVDGKAIGALGTVAGKSGLAIIRTDKAGAAMAAGKPILVEDHAIEVSLASWSGLSFPADSTGE